MGKRPLLGFLAGFVSVLVFHQATVAVLHALGLVPWAPYRTAPIPPFGVPAVLSAAFWGGLWGVGFAAVERRLPRGAAFWRAAFLFGALAPTLVAWFVVLPLKGLPPGGGFRPVTVVAALLVNGAWGLGTALVFRWLTRR